MRFRKKPVVIEAWQFMGHGVGAPDWVNTSWFYEEIIPPHPGDPDKKRVRGSPLLQIPTLEGIMRANIGDWIIHGVKGEVYPCKPDIFEATYEPCASAGAKQ